MLSDDAALKIRAVEQFTRGP
ncbi:MAG: hypothetical protein GYB48_05915 [Gammaproteobacteria bacterium]|nr:hypothetical protein [Gammaproteobacteria bacterium]MBU3008241.1 hypothetical protein [Cobetia amphilecti]UTV88685.1 hypothetical protein KDX00_07255 [Cobetia litoralis]